MEKTIQALKEKYEKLGQNPETYLQGLLHAKPITYWDYIQVGTLLSLQRTRTDFKDEKIFIIYHQVTELVLNLIVHELEQLSGTRPVDIPVFTEKIQRINRYTGLLCSSFAILTEGLDYDDYNTYRLTLTPASGFQSVQFRYIELYCTPIDNLINERGKARMQGNPDIAEKFNHLYWKDAGTDWKTGEKSLTMKIFEEKYQDALISFAENIQGKTIYDQFLRVDNTDEKFDGLNAVMREFDDLYNVQWPVVHLGTANTYLNKKGESKTATGSSDWQKYLHPAYQRRIFFPRAWSEEEKEQWGKAYLKD